MKFTEPPGVIVPADAVNAAMGGVRQSKLAPAPRSQVRLMVPPLSLKLVTYIR